MSAQCTMKRIGSSRLASRLLRSIETARIVTFALELLPPSVVDDLGILSIVERDLRLGFGRLDGHRAILANLNVLHRQLVLGLVDRRRVLARLADVKLGDCMRQRTDSLGTHRRSRRR